MVSYSFTRQEIILIISLHNEVFTFFVLISRIVIIATAGIVLTMKEISRKLEYWFFCGYCFWFQTIVSHGI